MVRVHTHLTTQQLRDMKTLARRLGMSRAELLRSAIRELLDRHKGRKA